VLINVRIDFVLRQRQMLLHTADPPPPNGLEMPMYRRQEVIEPRLLTATPHAV
jgi:hypothetical protein